MLVQTLQEVDHLLTAVIVRPVAATTGQGRIAADTLLLLPLYKAVELLCFQ